ncbi:turgor pressure sensor kinase KdpD [Gordonia hirsuta DSM 44140 = NBRC 16056]|uniref:histidine kinase n=1 Tax=Gordonia hirsuta DSM 44140 = NBRC 16056 TaxID=1121927 RepID=L7LD66_9ACTN|nr:sensor histidine kinase KdpD [Gordonia hirsuta]GAC58701.1 turgor pressure sensor kinase KdpD [Gordonia hirsuta DSM 44140 = NBRC 16056]
MGTQAPARGQFEVFLGCAPGVGKTFEMLDSAQILRAEGVDVVVGIVESHGRAATATMCEGLEVVPRRRVIYRGAILEELDVDAVLARSPRVVLVDELAHTNAQGLGNAKRWQDIEVLLDAGITVLSTVNIQHLESLNDVIAQITGITQQETVPDDVVRRADQIELVDIEPSALRRRLVEGKVYSPERAEGALANFFRQGNLTALRELALLWLADRVDEKLTDYRAANAITETWEARERVVVAVTGGIESAALIRRARRVASRSSAELLVVRVARGDGLTDTGADVAAVRALAADCGAEFSTVVGDDVPTALLDYARAVNATQLVLGTSRHPRWRRLLDEGVAAAVIRDSGRIDVHMVTHAQASRNRFDIRQTRLHRPMGWLLALVIPGIVAAILVPLNRVLGTSSESALFLVGILAVALLGGVGAAALSALVSGLLLNFLFLTPRYTLTVSDPDNLITTVVMLIVAVAVAGLVDSATVRRREAQLAARDAELLSMFSSAVLEGAGVPDLLAGVRETYQQEGATAVQLGDGDPLVRAVAGTGPPQCRADATTVCEAAGGGYALLLRGPEVSTRDRRVLAAVASQVVAALERDRLSAEVAEADELARTDELRRALLAAVSHDLRTPLAAAKAAVSSLRTPDLSFDAGDTAELLATIEESVDQLTALVGNLLDSSRLAAGVVRPVLRRTYLPEVVHRVFAASHAEKWGSTRFGCAWAYTDAGLLDRALANLVDNARRHGAGTVEVVTATVVRADGRTRCELRVIDHGPGIPVDERGRVFQPFHQYGDQRRGNTGVGLGLAVADGFVSALGGTLMAEETPGGGTTMVIDLPGEPEGEGGDPDGRSRSRARARRRR